MRPLCSRCGVNVCVRKRTCKDGRIVYRHTCSPCHKKRKARSLKKDHCDYCGFIALHLCQLDLDHIDGDHSNNEPENLQTLCANCHRLKTYNNKDYL